MKREYFKWYSNNIGKDMELLVHGHAGIPFMIFPCSSGRFFDFEDRKMFNTVENHINDGKVIFFSVDSLDSESWNNYNSHPSVGAARHEDYDKYIVNEVVPFINNYLGNKDRIIAGGASMGAYHGVNFFLRHPDVFGGTLALSGNYHLGHFVGDYMDDNVYFNSPTVYLPYLTDTWFLEKYRSSKIIICVGQGAWEETMIEDTRQMQEILKAKNIPALIDFWGHDADHAWPWWEKQFPYFVDKILNW